MKKIIPALCIFSLTTTIIYLEGWAKKTEIASFDPLAWKTKVLNEPFTYLGKAITPRSDEVDDWDNHRIQDPDIAYISELGGYIMTCNFMDRDGIPGGNFPTLKGNQTRVIGVFYHKNVKVHEGKKK